ncbi:Nucleotide-binding universal stress protein, UspA family [Pseudomonas cuatrocienegasensis]|uniref:Nucleotide-binding universal stress protein, UspA family n=1 Tax=Pseudomonas cuatrocienegasensis TaxID=543360 RepID=A0ABY1B5Y9_9PSED|nr:MULTISPECIES: universal stress protein [Pseudomonas]OEC36659.1 universal stress protein UspA [Pseudomonas sp. 21C1]SEQ02430.1 Nucleotide-binding universal stress protein, UspA family [Pseudomonas cuatrocienegasensis]
MFTHILIAHDLRDTADMALRRAAQLAEQHGARLSVLHVLDPAQTSEQHEKARQALDRSLTAFAPGGSALLVRSGKPSEVVLQEVQAQACDLLVLGGHQQRHDFFSGTSLDRIARQCPVPLLLVARNEIQPYSRALSAIDFSLCACSALEQGYRLLPADAQLHAVHVFDPDKGTPGQIEAQQQIQRALIEQLLHDEAQKLPDKGARLSHSVYDGGILRRLQEQLKVQRSDLLVLGSHGRSALSQALLGSLAQHFLHKAPCDVLVVR